MHAVAEAILPQILHHPGNQNSEQKLEEKSAKTTQNLTEIRKLNYSDTSSMPFILFILHSIRNVVL